MKRSGLITAFTSILISLLAACSSQRAPLQPPLISYGQDLCDQCGMLIDDPKFAAALILENGESRKFDDVGEMFEFVSEHPQDAVRAWFVHDYVSEIWINGEAAFYVVGNELASPMGSGVAVFEIRQAAEAFASERKANVLTFEQMWASETGSK